MFSLYDVTIIDDDFNYKFIQVLALSKIDAMHIVEIKYPSAYIKGIEKSII